MGGRVGGCGWVGVGGSVRAHARPFVSVAPFVNGPAYGPNLLHSPAPFEHSVRTSSIRQRAGMPILRVCSRARVCVRARMRVCVCVRALVSAVDFRSEALILTL